MTQEFELSRRSVLQRAGVTAGLGALTVIASVPLGAGAASADTRLPAPPSTMGVFTAHATLTGGWGAHEDSRARKNYYVWRRMQGGTSVQIKLDFFTSQYNRTGYCGHWANLAYQIEVSLRRQSDGATVSRVRFNDEQQGVTKTLAVPATGGYAYSFELFHPGNPHVPEPYASNYNLLCHLEQYYSPNFRFQSTFTSNTN